VSLGWVSAVRRQLLERKWAVEERGMRDFVGGRAQPLIPLKLGRFMN